MALRVKIRINDNNYEGWESVSVRQTMETLTPGFRFSLADIGPASIEEIIPGAKVEIIADQDGFETPIVTGFIDARERSRTGDKTGVTVSGRGITSDIVDCSAIYQTNTFTDVFFADMVKQLVKPFGTVLTNNLDETEKIKSYTMKSGSSVFDVISENAQKIGALLSEDREGRLLLSYAGTYTRSDIDLVDGKNIEKLTEKWDTTKQFSDYVLKGQTTGAAGKPWLPDVNITLKAKTKDSSVQRYRPKILNASGKVTSSRMKQQVKYEAQVRKGNAKYYTCEVDGWFQGDGLPWGINTAVNLESEKLGVNKLLLITGAELAQSNQGTRAKLTLKDLNTYSKV